MLCDPNNRDKWSCSDQIPSQNHSRGIVEFLPYHLHRSAKLDAILGPFDLFFLACSIWGRKTHPVRTVKMISEVHLNKNIDFVEDN